MLAYEDGYYEDVEKFLEDYEKEDILDWDEDATVEFYECELQPMFQAEPTDVETIVECLVDEGRYSENNCDKEFDKIVEIFKKNINFAKINEEVPKLWYPTREKIVFTKQELLEIYEKL